ncbi:MAG: Maf family protein [Hyphomicrobiaceae bacterium]
MAEPARQRLVLASGSLARRRMLAAAGVGYDFQASTIDERSLMAQGPVEGDDFAVAIANRLAAAKAVDVSQHFPDAIVVGSDQTLNVVGGNELMHKPANLEAAAAQLRTLRGRAHWLTSAVTIVDKGQVVWRHHERALMTMRDFSDAYLDTYLARVGENVCSSVGCYHLEGFGIQLFEKIEGDYFTILGMPLLPLLNELRRRKVIPT